MNQFLAVQHKNATFTENGAIAHSSTGSLLADQFSTAGTFRGREIKTVFAEQSALDSTIGTVLALRFVFYLRTVTRTPKGTWFEGEDLLKGQGNRDESFKRYLWYLNNKPEAFYKNLWLFMVCGSYKDLWELIALAKTHNMTVDEEKIFEVYAMAMNEKNLDDLALKYLPQIVSNKKAKTDRAKLRNKLAKSFADYLALNQRAYRQLKSSGKAHTWQQHISKGLFENIEFGKISGKALSNFVSSKFLVKHNLTDVYTQWIQAQPTAKFTGYVYELFKQVAYNMPVYKKMTIDKQFDGLIQMVEQAENGGIHGNVWCALDTSASMTWEESRVAKDIFAYEVCLGLGIYFSTLNKGAFHKSVIAFSSTSEVRKLSGSFCDMVAQAKGIHSGGSTNFQSVIDEIIRIRKGNPNIPLADYPLTLLVVSDMQFNPTGNANTNHQEAMRKLATVFPAEWVADFKVIWWRCTGRAGSIANQPSSIDEGGTYVFSGYDGSIVSILLGGKAQEKNADKKAPSMEELILEALSQEALLQVRE